MSCILLAFSYLTRRTASGQITQQKLMRMFFLFKVNYGSWYNGHFLPVPSNDISESAKSQVTSLYETEHQLTCLSPYSFEHALNIFRNWNHKYNYIFTNMWESMLEKPIKFGLVFVFILCHLDFNFLFRIFYWKFSKQIQF